MMKLFGFVFSALLVSQTAYGQIGPLPPHCAVTTRTVDGAPSLVSAGWVTSFESASRALVARDYGEALSRAADARQHSVLPGQFSALKQIEVAAYVGLDQRTDASAKMQDALSDKCIPVEVRDRYASKLGEWKN